MKRARPLTIADLPKTYAALVELYPPRPIHTKADYQRAASFVDLMAGHDLHEDQADYLDAISIMIERYEADRLNARLASIRPVDAVRHLMEENALTVSDLGRIVGSQPLASLILSGKRSISREASLRLARRFAVSPALFLESAGAGRKTA